MKRATPILFVLLAIGSLCAGEIRFVDVGPASGIDMTMVSGRSPSTEILEVNGGGVAVFDYDGDGKLDLFLANGATMDDPERGPGSRLFRNLGEWRFRDVTEDVGIALRRWAMGVTVGDYDGDGDEDLYVTCFGPNVMLRNDVSRNGKFTDATESTGTGDSRWGTSAAFADLDGDRDLDLYVTNYLEFDPKKVPDRKGQFFMGVDVFAGPRGLTPQQDVLYENLGDGRFRDITAKSGVARERPGYGLGVVTLDADADGKLDVYVGNDSTENFLFKNRGKLEFTDIGVAAGVAANYDGATQATMGIAVADVDGNGLPDLFSTNFSSDTNTLHLNRGAGWFDDRTSQFGLGMVSRRFLGWGVAFADFDLDGDQDLFVANGHVYPEATVDSMDSDYEQVPLVFERHGKRFRVARDAGAPLAVPRSARSVAAGDLDGDGDVDVVMTVLNAPVILLRNDSAASGGALVVELRDATGSPRHPGAMIELTAEGVIAHRWIGGGSFQSVDTPAAHFALPPAVESAKLKIVWPDGVVETHVGARPGRRVVATRGEKKLRSFKLVPREPDTP